MKGIIRQVGADTDATRENIEKTLAASEFFWLDLDLHDPGPTAMSRGCCAVPSIFTRWR